MSDNSGKRKKILLAHAILWGALILATAAILVSGGAADRSFYLILIVFVPGWFASDRLLHQALDM